MIRFFKILSYRLEPEAGDVFEYLSGLLSQRIDPLSAEQGGLKLSEPVVLHSTLCRAAGCISRNKSIEYIGLVDLNEIAFDLEKLCGKSAWTKEKSVAVRRQFKEGFVQDRLLLSRREIFDGVRRVLLHCQNKSGIGSIAVVSHSFRLAIIEAYIMTRGLIETEPSLIHNYISDNRKRYEFGGGFEIEVLSLPL